MSKQMMIYERTVALHKDTHRDWSVVAGEDFSFAKDVNSVPLLGPEFRPASRDFVIVFAVGDDVVLPSVMLGIYDNKNAYVDATGRWTHGYVPAFLRRYPFAFAETNDGDTLTLCVDAEFGGFNTEGKGERLFDDKGDKTEYLEKMFSFTQEFHALYQRTVAFGLKLRELDLLEPSKATFNLPDGSSRDLSGFSRINKEKLMALPDETLGEMVRTGELELCYDHLRSLDNVNALVQRATAS